MTSGFTGLFSIGCANGAHHIPPSTARADRRIDAGFLTLRLFALWDHRKSAKVILFAVFGVSYAVIVGFFAWTLSAIFRAPLLSSPSLPTLTAAQTRRTTTR